MCGGIILKTMLGKQKYKPFKIYLERNISSSVF